MTILFITTNFYKILLFECYFINNLFKKKSLLQKCRNFLIYLYFRIVLFMYFSFNKIYSKLIFIYIFIQYLIFIFIFTYNIFYYNEFLSDNLLIINNILLDNYSIFENINLDISNNPELNTNFNVVYFDNNNSLIPSNNNGNDNNMNNMNNKNNFDNLNINDIFNKSKKNTEDDSNTDTITLFNRIIHLKNTNPLILDMIKTYIFDNDNNILQDESVPLVNNDFINNKDKDNNLLTLNNNLITYIL